MAEFHCKKYPNLIVNDPVAGTVCAVFRKGVFKTNDEAVAAIVGKVPEVTVISAPAPKPEQKQEQRKR